MLIFCEWACGQMLADFYKVEIIQVFSIASVMPFVSLFPFIYLFLGYGCSSTANTAWGSNANAHQILTE